MRKSAVIITEIDAASEIAVLGKVMPTLTT